VHIEPAFRDNDAYTVAPIDHSGAPHRAVFNLCEIAIECIGSVIAEQAEDISAKRRQRRAGHELKEKCPKSFDCQLLKNIKAHEWRCFALAER
jgi:hypothetical protein